MTHAVPSLSIDSCSTSNHGLQLNEFRFVSLCDSKGQRIDPIGIRKKLSEERFIAFHSRKRILLVDDLLATNIRNQRELFDSLRQSRL